MVVCLACSLHTVFLSVIKDAHALMYVWTQGLLWPWNCFEASTKLIAVRRCRPIWAPSGSGLHFCCKSCHAWAEAPPLCCTLALKLLIKLLLVLWYLCT